MGTVKKSIAVLIATLTLLVFMFFPACVNSDIIEKERTCKTWVMDWCFGRHISMSIDTYLGVPFHYGYEDATITVCNDSDNGIIVFDQFAEVVDADRFSDYAHYYKHKQVTHSEVPFEFSGDTLFWWVTDTDWWDWEDRGENMVDDYISFIAWIDKKIVGYAVIYIWSDGEEGGGEVLADNKFPQVNGRLQKVSKKYVNTKINEIIEANKNLLA